MNYALQKNISRLGEILCRLALLGVAAGIGMLFSQILVLFIYLILLLIGLLSLLTLFFNESFRRLFDVTNSFNDLIMKAQSLFPMIMGISLALLVCGFLCQIVDYKTSSSRPKLIFYGIFTIFIGLMFAIVMLGGFTHV